MDRLNHSLEYRRVALGQMASLGDLYDARSDNILPNSILKTKEPHTNFVRTMKKKHMVYRQSTSDSLSEKLSNLDVYGDLSLSLLSGMLKCDLAANYITRKNSKSHVRQASRFCAMHSEIESLQFDLIEAEHLNLNALTNNNATHVITRIEWGAQTVIIAKDVVSNVIENRHIGGKPPGSYANDKTIGENSTGGSKKPSEGKDIAETVSNDKQDDQKASKEMMRMSLDNSNTLTSMLAKLGDIKIGGDVHIQEYSKEETKNLDFEIITDVADFSNGSLPTDYAGVLDFVRTMPSAMKTVNGGKGVPLVFHLTPIQDIAARFNIQLKHDLIVKRLDEACVLDLVRILDELDTNTRKSKAYEDFAQQYSFCVPEAQLKKAKRYAREAGKDENALRNNLREVMYTIRYQNGDAIALQELINEYEEDQSNNEEHSSIWDEYKDKAKFADEVMSRGALYTKVLAEDIQYAITAQKLRDVFVLHFSETSRNHPDWLEHRQRIMDILDEKNMENIVIIVDEDIGHYRKLERPYIEQYRGGKLIVEDVIEDMKELADKCIVKCSDPSKVDRSRSSPLPTDRRLVKLQCPGLNCFSGTKFKWTCITCRDFIFYGIADEYLYCKCARYPYSLAIFKCKKAVHGHAWTKPDEEQLLKQLGKLEESREYNILLLGKTGIGKSTFINAFLNYLEFNSLEEALADPGPLRYQIPTSFLYQEDKRGKSMANSYVPTLDISQFTPWISTTTALKTPPRPMIQMDCRVNVGEETEDEIYPKESQSATRKTKIHSFKIGDAIIRFIDTPGIGDTGGVKQDRKNVRDILATLENVNKLNAILFLLDSGNKRSTVEFKFCMTELLCHLHEDAMKNILFGYTKSSSVEWDVADARVAVKTILKDLNTKITLNQDNQFLFDSGGFRYLACYKQKGYRLQGPKAYEKMWNRSTEAAYELINTVEKLPTHEVQKTLCFNRTRGVLEEWAKPLTEFALAMQKSERICESRQKELKTIDTNNDNYVEVLKDLETVKFVPVQKPLAKPQVICGHEECYPNKICHDDCNIIVPDDSKPNQKLEGCYAFRKYLIRHYGECHVCQHDWTHHMRRSYTHEDEEQPINREQVSHYAQLLEQGMSNKEVQNLAMKEAQDNLKAIQDEEEQVMDAQTKLGIYVGQNALASGKAVIAKQNDATIRYLDIRLATARNDQNYNDVKDLEDQKRDLQEKLKNLEQAIVTGEAESPTETDVYEAIEGLRNMKIFGPHIREAIDSRDIQLDDYRLVPVSLRDHVKESRRTRFWKSLVELFP